MPPCKFPNPTPYPTLSYTKTRVLMRAKGGNTPPSITSEPKASVRFLATQPNSWLPGAPSIISVMYAHTISQMAFLLSSHQVFMETVDVGDLMWGSESNSVEPAADDMNIPEDEETLDDAPVEVLQAFDGQEDRNRLSAVAPPPLHLRTVICCGPALHVQLIFGVYVCPSNAPMRIPQPNTLPNLILYKDPRADARQGWQHAPFHHLRAKSIRTVPRHATQFLAARRAIYNICNVCSHDLPNGFPSFFAPGLHGNG